MFDKFRLSSLLEKIDSIITEPSFKNKLHDLIPDINDFNVKVMIKNSGINIQRKNNDKSIDNLVIKYTPNLVEYYYFSTSNFNDCGKFFKTKNNVVTKYCYYDIKGYYNKQDVKTKTMIFVYDNDLNEIYKCIEDDIENYVIIGGKKVFAFLNNKDKNVLTRKKQIRTKNNKIITIVETKYYSEFMKKYNSTKYFLDTKVREKFVYFPSDCSNVSLSRKKYLSYMKKSSAKC